MLDLSPIIKLAQPWLIYLLLALHFAAYYREYIRGGATLWKLFLIGSSFVVFLFALYIVCITVGTTILFVPTIVVTLIATIALRTKSYRCKKRRRM